MDAVISGSASVTRSLPLPPLHTVSAFASSTSYTVPLTHSLWAKQRFCSLRTRHSFGNYWCTVRQLKLTCGAVTEIKESEFKETVLKASRPVLVEFVATWCGPCRLVAPAMESLAQEYEDRLTVVKIDHDANPGLIEEYKVYGLPTLILFKNGQEVPESRREGAITKVKLKEYLDALLESMSVS
ncbi:hypothetical protein Fmac_023005 [Flemingia macrophylla]|uniref:Thioredoxin domain-containing protein n=1 Tax=Flemingia macrophylla TaxID=520843 RepID=A0ABD1LKA1_9FABA